MVLGLREGIGPIGCQHALELAAEPFSLVGPEKVDRSVCAPEHELRAIAEANKTL